jgi:hypothetical protein
MAVILVGWSSGHFHERTWHITVTFTIAIIGFCIAAASLRTPVRYTALFIFPIGAYSANAVIIGWAATTLSQTKEKKSVSFFLPPVVVYRWLVANIRHSRLCWP